MGQNLSCGQIINIGVIDDICPGHFATSGGVSRCRGDETERATIACILRREAYRVGIEDVDIGKDDLAVRHKIRREFTWSIIGNLTDLPDEDRAIRIYRR